MAGFTATTTVKEAQATTVTYDDNNRIATLYLPIDMPFEETTTIEFAVTVTENVYDETFSSATLSTTIQATYVYVAPIVDDSEYSTPNIEEQSEEVPVDEPV